MEFKVCEECKKRNKIYSEDCEFCGKKICISCLKKLHFSMYVDYMETLFYIKSCGDCKEDIRNLYPLGIKEATIKELVREKLVDDFKKQIMVEKL